MLFSDAEIVSFIESHFEPVWQSVRPVPLVCVDFGGGASITRTIHGNIATYVCTSSGQVLDIVPGLYTPKKYRQVLDQMALLAAWAKEAAPGNLERYHQAQAQALASRKGTQRFINMADISKARVEGRVRAMLVSGPPPPPETSAPVATLTSEQDVSIWSTLEQDTAINEQLRRRQIHAHLGSLASATPSSLTKWLYSDVLHTDLDDPYLGLGSTLLESDPFEDR